MMLKTIIKGLDRFFDGAVEGAGKGAGIVTVVLTLVVGIDLITRFFFSKPVPNATQIGSYLFFIACMLAIGYTQKYESHVSIEVIVTRFPPRLRTYLGIFGLFATLLFVCYMVFRYSSFFLESLLLHETGIGMRFLPVAWVKVFFPVGFILLAVMLIKSIFKRLKSLKE